MAARNVKTRLKNLFGRQKSSSVANGGDDVVRVLFVCMGNICRSPTAEGVFRHLLRQHGLETSIEIDSAGTLAYHVGKAADSRARKAAAARGIDLDGITARRIDVRDFEVFDYVLAMDRDNLHNLRKECPEHLQHKVTLFMENAPHLDESEVPDPYYGGSGGFERVLDLVEVASEGLLNNIRRAHTI
ncbi:MAG: low molecular weight phosphotyrosine protein phosphatase [Gammaproteobacteria bacterium]|nr:low molecular weight phosphotyrosine protein phosphatase [Gammaproteobacteria bacterium]